VFGGLFDGYAEDCWLFDGSAVVSLAVIMMPGSIIAYLWMTK
jgi:hypothetical protein